MESKGLFKSWVPNWLVIFTLVFCMLHSMVLLGVYTSNVTYAASFLDVEPEDLQFSLSVTYGTFLATILIESRLFKFFPTKTYFVAIYALAAISFVLSVQTKNFALFIVLRFVEGILMALPWLPMRQLLITRFSSRNATIIAFTFNYGMLLLASPFIMNIAVWLLDNFDWSYMAYGSAILQMCCVGLVMLTFRSGRMHRKFPLYQVDWISYILVLTAILSFAFLLIYGEKYYWFRSDAVKISAASGTIASLLFLLRQEGLKRPVFDFGTFRFRDLRVGFMLFLLFYVGRASLNSVHQLMFSVWNWEPVRVGHVQLVNVLGNIVGMVLAAIFVSRKVSSQTIFIFGFSLMALYHFWFTFLFLPDVAFADIFWPYIIQGISVGMLLVPMVLFTISSVPTPFAPYAGTVGVAGRFWGSTIGFCLLQNVGVYLQKDHFTTLTRSLNPENPEVSARIASASEKFISVGYSREDAAKIVWQQMGTSVQKQALLLSDMEIFTVMGWLFAAVVVYLLFNRHLKMGLDIMKNRVWGS